MIRALPALAAVLAVLSALAGCGTGVREPPVSGPWDPDIEPGRTCPGDPSPSDLLASMPDRVGELVVLWPRVGRRQARSGCSSVARLTMIDHQGVVVTFSFVLYPRDRLPVASDYQVIVDDPMPRAVLELPPDPERPWLLAEVAGAPSTTRDSLERVLELVGSGDAVQRFAPD